MSDEKNSVKDGALGKLCRPMTKMVAIK